MKIDASHQISAVRRQLGNRTLEAGEARVMTLSQVYATDPEDLWDACTNPERIPRWFLPIEGELRQGGTYQLQGHASGTIERCDPPKGFAATWEFGGEVSWIEVRLSPEGDGTRFELEHVAHVDGERWAEFGPGAVGIGWDMLLMGLDLHTRTGEPVDMAEAMAWQASEEGKRFVTEVGERWYVLDVECGTPAGAAREAADRCIAAYTATEA